MILIRPIHRKPNSHPGPNAPSRNQPGTKIRSSQQEELFLPTSRAYMRIKGPLPKQLTMFLFVLHVPLVQDAFSFSSLYLKFALFINGISENCSNLFFLLLASWETSHLRLAAIKVGGEVEEEVDQRAITGGY